MDYKKIYQKIMLAAQSQNRKKSKEQYYESHHIVPDFMFSNRTRKGPKGHLPGDPESPSNKVLLTAKEHFIAHVLLYKILKNTRYGYAAGSALQFFFVKVIGDHPRTKNFVGAKKYEKYRLIGLDSISKSRKGKMPAKDAITGIPVGSVDVTHPKVVSGEWVHHSKGKKPCRKSRIDTTGKANNNYKSIDPIEFSDAFLKSNRENFFFRKMFLSEYNSTKQGRQTITGVFIVNHFGSWENFVATMNSILSTNFEYNPYYRSLDQRKKASIESKKYKWITQDGIRKRVKKTEMPISEENNAEN
jgi:hypothetical protein